MLGSAVYLISILGSGNVLEIPQYCAVEKEAVKVVYRLSDLPDEIRVDLMTMSQSQMVDGPVTLRQGDAPTEAERLLPTSKFNQGLLIRGTWFVQFEITNLAGVRTIGYVRSERHSFVKSPIYYFTGPACATLEAALAGVITPGGFNF